MSPCICILANIEKQIRRIREKEEEDEKNGDQPEIGKKRKRETEEEEGTPHKQYKESVQIRTPPLYLVGGHTEITKECVITVCPSMGAETRKKTRKPKL